MPLVVCSKCKLTKAAEEFYHRWRTRDGAPVHIPTQPCKSCLSAARFEKEQQNRAERPKPNCPVCGKSQQRVWWWRSPKGTMWATCRMCRDSLKCSTLQDAMGAVKRYAPHNREVEKAIMDWKADRDYRPSCGSLAKHKATCEAYEGIWRRIVVILAKG